MGLLSLNFKQKDGFFHYVHLLHFWLLMKPSRNILALSFLCTRYILPVGSCCCFFFWAAINFLIIYSIFGRREYSDTFLWYGQRTRDSVYYQRTLLSQMKLNHNLLLCKVCEAAGQAGATQSCEGCVPATDFTKETGSSGEIGCLPAHQDWFVHLCCR